MFVATLRYPHLRESVREGKSIEDMYLILSSFTAVLETWVQSLGWEDPLEKGKATHSRILAWRIPWSV